MGMSDWSSDVCSSDLKKNGIETHFFCMKAQREAFLGGGGVDTRHQRNTRFGVVGDEIEKRQPFIVGQGIVFARRTTDDQADRKSVVSGKSVSVRVDLGGRRIIKKKKKQKQRQ